MAVRRPFNPSGQSAPLVGSGGAQQPRPPMTMAPSPQGAAPAPGAGGPAVAPGSGAPQPAPAPLPPPIQPGAGGPTSPLNIRQMLDAKMTPASGGLSAPGGPAPMTPLPPWGDSTGSGARASTGSALRLGYAGGDASPDASLAADAMQPESSTDDTKGGMSPLVMLRLLKQMGHV